MPHVIQRTLVNNAIDRQIFIIYGKAGIGKSTLASQFPDPLFISTEPGLNHLELNKIDCYDWETFLRICDALKNQSIKIINKEGEEVIPKTIVIDTIDNLTSYCSAFICKREGWDHPADPPQGKGWSTISSELHFHIHTLVGNPYGYVFVSHDKIDTIRNTNMEYSHATISLTGAGNRKVFLDLADIILYLSFEVHGGADVE